MAPMAPPVPTPMSAGTHPREVDGVVSCPAIITFYDAEYS